MSVPLSFEEVFPFVKSGRVDLDKFVRFEESSRFLDQGVHGVFIPDLIIEPSVRGTIDPEWVTVELEAGHFRALQVLAKSMKMASPHLNVMLRDKEALKARLGDIASFHSTPTCRVTSEDAYSYLLLSLLGGGPKKWFEGLTETGRYETFDADVIGWTMVKKGPKNAARVTKKGFHGQELSVWPRPRNIADLVAECTKIGNAVCAMNVEFGDTLAGDAVDYVAKCRLLTTILQSVGSALTNCVLRHLSDEVGFVEHPDAPNKLKVLTGAFGVAMYVATPENVSSRDVVCLGRVNHCLESLLGTKTAFSIWPCLPKLPVYQHDADASSRFFFGSVKKRKAGDAVDSPPAGTEPSLPPTAEDEESKSLVPRPLPAIHVTQTGEVVYLSH